MTDDNNWLYTDERLALREQCLKILLHAFPSDSTSSNNQALYECAHDWVSQGNRTTAGITAYYRAYYE